MHAPMNASDFCKLFAFSPQLHVIEHFLESMRFDLQAGAMTYPTWHHTFEPADMASTNQRCRIFALLVGCRYLQHQRMRISRCRGHLDVDLVAQMLEDNYDSIEIVVMKAS